MLKVGDTVTWRGAWGSGPAAEVVVKSIEVCEPGCKEGEPVDAVSWDLTQGRQLVVILDNGHWAYGNQLEKLSD